MIAPDHLHGRSQTRSYGIDLSMRTVSDDLGWVSANIDAFDTFARSLKVVHPNDITVD